MQFDLKLHRLPEGIVQSRLAATDLAAARAEAERQGYAVLSVRPASAVVAGAGRGRRFDVDLFGQELLALMDAGMGLVESLSLLGQRARAAETRAVLSGVLSLVATGQSFSRALESAPQVFPLLFVASVRASERTGGLVEGLQRYLAYAQQIKALRSKMISAAIYPAILSAAGAVVVVFLLTYVVPRFSSVYAGLGQAQLPLMSQWLMHWGQFASSHMALVASWLVAAPAAVALALRSSAVRARIERGLWRMPRVGEQIHIYQLARFTRTVAMLLKGGVPLVSALETTGSLLRQPALQQGLAEAIRQLREGKGLSETFRAQRLATEVGVRLLAVGERSGSLGDTLDRVAAFYEEENARQLERFSRAFEPMLMVGMGLLIGGIVILMYLPIFQLASSIQ